MEVGGADILRIRMKAIIMDGNMMKCSYCNTYSDEEFTNCAKCGAPISIEIQETKLTPLEEIKNPIITDYSELKVNSKLVSSNRFGELFIKGVYIVMALLVLDSCSAIVLFFFFGR